MNILVISEVNPFANSNATCNRFLSLAEGLVDNGCKIDLLFTNGYYSKFEKNKFEKKGTYNNINYKYLRPVNLWTPLFRLYYNRIFPNLFLLRKIKKQLKKKKYEYIWLDFSPRVVIIGIKLFKQNINIKYFHERSEYSWIGLSKDNKLHKKYLEKFLPQIDVFSIMTFSLISYYKKYVAKKTKLVHLPMTVDFSRFNKPIVENLLRKPYIGYCGTLNNAKDGVDILIQSFIKIMNLFPDLHLYIAGPLIPEKDYLSQKSIISRSNAEKRITYLGSIQKEEMPNFLSNASILALARPVSKQAEGGFPTKLGEYLATGNPVCITNVGDIGYYLKDGKTAFIANPDSLDSFSDALVRALTNRDAAEIGISGKKVAYEYFNKDIQSKTLYNILVKSDTIKLMNLK